MPFVNEFIPAEDVERFDLKTIDEKVYVGRTRARDWTVDRERNIYFRNIASGGGADPEIRNRTEWNFFWGGELIYLRLDLISSGEESDRVGWSQWKLMWLNGSSGLPPHLKDHKSQILADLKEALVAYRSFGVYSRDWSGYRVILEIDQGCVA
ncbi:MULTISPECIES: hypothetical protein [unclassified Lysobacter]|uniref:hypothetical protein n=1 Tax=unclassified Lysobacter TaxID=2635362 RepID=UPI001BE5EA59|nr:MULTISPECIES: hypothetical protein [unclassified Lysobacter]MBT2746632.1 hypothetical protein [Lysobacter sp. ISL-42]MBT2753373.1 hypothetical protein [Lysobacter sp. ISL-50]MBT2775483.1 hypothetical protein [Lysobacter sp. ISL-54]MBT2782981.1 hypothetical protein [Lysobacter sp. ISL-52]